MGRALLLLDGPRAFLCRWTERTRKQGHGLLAQLGCDNAVHVEVFGPIAK
jgi:hypothetical protein